ncbi:MAG: putative ABC transporter permease [Oscillospiraceae bacterium]
MGFFLIITFIFFIGSLVGWIIELFYRKFISKANPERKWINPGFLVGPYLPLYGFGLVAMYLLAQINVSFIENDALQKTLLFILMSMVMTIIEYIAGIIFIKGMKVKLWDYTNEWGNVQGIICPKFSFYWAILSAIYYFLIHPHILNSLYWLAEHLAFSFFIGFFYGIFIIDVVYSMQILVKVKKFATDHDIIVKYQELKRSIRLAKEEYKEKKSFIFAFKSEHSLSEHLKKYLELEMAVFNDNMDNAKEKLQSKIEETQGKIQDKIEETQGKIQDKIDEKINKK